MKKVFRVLSLIAILMVAFTSQAVANDNVDKTEVVYDVGYNYNVVSVEVGVGVFYVADEPVNYSSVNSLYESVNIVNSYYFRTSFTMIYLPHLNEYVNNYKKSDYETPSTINRVSANIGKFTKITIHN